ncbi:MAG: hypothetical protein JRF63_04360 [Deltaproteobacteria bacterium]|nr:hypothetical protein [Deltaproteobacteria bacterium]
MTNPDDELRELVRGASDNVPVPDFESSWRRAEARSEERSGRGVPSPWRWALGPAVAVGAAACVALLVLAIGPTDSDSDETQLLALADAGAQGSDSSMLADLETPTVPVSALTELGGATGESVASADGDTGETRPGYGLYAAGTDFLLTMEIPAWDQAGERSVL